ncbi:MAG: hypothetical protein JJU24_01915 [Natronohydrobacter sp.]|nr:hypothetical protein [Natronohydrobacter sp.]
MDIHNPISRNCIHPRQGRISTGLRLVAGLALAVGLSACQMSSQGGQTSRTELAEALSEYRIVPTGRAFVSVPNALLVMERDLGVALEQRITLPNATTLAGENTIQLRAQTSRSSSATRLQLTEILAQFGGVPSPFRALDESSLSSSTDQYGDVTYTVTRPGGDVTCVLAFRRSQIGARALPRGSSALDLMMRNCVTGSVQDALAPLGPQAFSLGVAR